MTTRRTSAAPISDRRDGFTLVETAVALAAAALFCSAVAVAVSALLRGDELQLRWAEAGLWHETVFTRRALDQPPLDPPPAAGWTAAADAVPLDGEGPVPGADRYRFAPVTRPAFEQTLHLPARPEER